MKAEFKFLCTTYQACSKVKEILKDMGFSDFKDLNKSPSFDISAKFELKYELESGKIAEKIFKKCKGKVQSIQITT